MATKCRENGNMCKYFMPFNMFTTLAIVSVFLTRGVFSMYCMQMKLNTCPLLQYYMATNNNYCQRSSTVQHTILVNVHELRDDLLGMTLELRAALLS